MRDITKTNLKTGKLFKLIGFSGFLCVCELIENEFWEFLSHFLRKCTGLAQKKKENQIKFIINETSANPYK